MTAFERIHYQRSGVELSNTIFIVTEYVVPLSVEIQNIKTQLSAPEMIAWGLYQVAVCFSNIIFKIIVVNW